MRGPAAAVLATTLACGCESSPTLPNRDPSIIGQIVARDTRTAISDGHPTIHVKKQVADECGIIFTVSSKTEISRRTPGGRLVRADPGELTPDRRVAVWTTIVLESCPAQASADVVEILSN